MKQQLITTLIQAKLARFHQTSTHTTCGLVPVCVGCRPN